MRRPDITSALVHGLLLVVVLGVAYWDWTRETVVGESGVAVWQIDPDGIEGLELRTERTLVKAELRDDGAGGSYPWFRIERTPLATPGSDEAPGDAPSEPEVEVKEFRGADRARDRLGELGRLEAERALGVLDAELLEGLGLDDDAGHLTLKTRGGDVRLDIGVKAVGDRLRYVRLPKSGEVYVIPDHLVSDMELADSRLLSRDLHSFPEEDVTEASVTVGDETRRYLHVQEGNKDFWASVDAPTEVDEQVSTWMSRLERLRVERYLLEGEDPFERAGVGVEVPEQSVEPVSLLRIDYRTKDGGEGFLTVERHGGGDDALYTARTEHTRADVVINRFLTQEAMQDLDGLFPGAAPAAEPEPAEVEEAEPAGAEAAEAPPEASEPEPEPEEATPAEPPATSDAPTTP